MDGPPQDFDPNFNWLLLAARQRYEDHSTRSATSMNTLEAPESAKSLT